MDAAEDEVACFEDIALGERYASVVPYVLARDAMIAFAREWDSRAYHVDEEAARRSIFGGLVACGAHVIAVWTRLSLEARRVAKPWAMLAGLGSEIRMPAPARPGDALHYTGEVIEKRLSASRPGTGLVRTRNQLTNQRGELVFESVATVLVRCRGPQASDG